MRQRTAATKLGLIVVLGLLLGAIPASAATGNRCTVVETGAGTGVVLTCCADDGFWVDVQGLGEVKLVGLGPAWYWEAAKYERPEVGDNVTVSWNVMQCPKVTQNVLVSIDYLEEDDPADDTLYLRDVDNVALWKGAQRHIMRQQRLANQHRNGQGE